MHFYGDKVFGPEHCKKASSNGRACEGNVDVAGNTSLLSLNMVYILICDTLTNGQDRRRVQKGSFMTNLMGKNCAPEFVCTEEK